MLLIPSFTLFYFAVILIQSLNAENISNQTNRSTPFDRLVGNVLYKWSADGSEIEEHYTLDLLNDKHVIGIYFSASWCGPCRQFTPQLATFYEKMNRKGKKFEIILVSHDRTPEDFASYFHKMPWLSVTWEATQAVAAKLAPMYQMKGLPHLVILEGDDASIITLDGRTQVMKDNYGLQFPWRPRTAVNMLPKPLKRIVKAQINRLLIIGKSIIDELTPTKLLHFVSRKAVNIGSYIFLIMKQRIREVLNNQSSKNSTNDGKNRQNRSVKPTNSVDLMVIEESENISV